MDVLAVFPCHPTARPGGFRRSNQPGGLRGSNQTGGSRRSARPGGSRRSACIAIALGLFAAWCGVCGELRAQIPAALPPMPQVQQPLSGVRAPGASTQSASQRSGSTQGVVTANYSEAAGVKPGDEPLTPEKITAEITAIEACTDIEADVKKEHIARLNSALEWLKSEQDSARRMADFETQLAALPELLKTVQEELSKPPAQLAVELPSGATVAQLETRLAELRRVLETDEATLRAKEEATENRAKRLADISKEATDIEKRLVDIKQQMAALVGTDLTTKTKLYELRARNRARQQQLATLKLEQQRLEGATELFPMERDLAKRTANNSKKILQLWQTAVDAWRREESLRQAKEARHVAENAHPALKSLATQNAEIAELRIKTAAGIQSLAKSLKKIHESSKEYAETFADLKNKVEHAGATSSTGVLLLKQRAELPAAVEFLERQKLVQKEMPEAHLKLMELNQLRREMSDPVEMATHMLGAFKESLADYDQRQVLDVLTRLLTDRRDFLERASNDQNTYLQDLNDLELANQALEEQVTEFRQYLDQRVMWIRSAEPFRIEDAKQAIQGAVTTFSPRLWFEVVRVGGGELLRRPAGGIAVISLFLLLLLGRARLLASQARLCEPPAADEPASFWTYVSALGIAVILSARWPVLLLAIGYRLKFAAGTTAWTQAVGEACLMPVVFLGCLELLREVCRRNGIGERLFHWHTAATSSVRNTLEMTLIVGTPLLAFLQLSRHGELAKLEGLERTLFVVTLTLFSLQLGILTRPAGRLMRSLTDDGSSNMLLVARTPIWLMATLSALALAVLSLLGYHFSAYQLSARLAESGAAVVGVIMLHSMFLGWLEVKSHNKQVRDQLARDTASHSAETVAEDSEHADDFDDLDAEPQAAIVAAPKSHQEFRDLLRYAALTTLICAGWFIWASVLPALRVLDHVELWQNIETVAETITNQDGEESIRKIEHSVPTTLTDVLVALLVCAGTVLIGRRLPGLLDLTVLERMPLDHGGRQAIAILARYAATIAGILIACQIIRLSWSSVQWLAAAMTVGLGFGLQEIFANLVSGLIILFERPIRAGDLVTVSNTTGHVTRMQMRATTITDFDRREMIVPNKTFITDNVINWTLSDPISRVVLPVGVAYGTDVQKTQNILLRIAKRSAFVLNEPAPSTLFKGFGDSTLNLELRVFIPKREMYLDVVNELNNAIVREFARANIEIAFPQRDLHIRSVESLAPLLGIQRDAEKSKDSRVA